MNNWHPETTVLIHSLGWALCHSLWQSLLLFIILRAVLKLVPASQSAIRYNVALAGLLGMTIWFADTWVQYWQKLQGIAVYITETTANNDLPAKSHIVTTLPKTVAGYDALSTFIYGLERWFPLLVSIYACGLVFLLFRFCLNLFKVHGLRSSGTPDADEYISARLLYWQEKLGISKKVRFLHSSQIDVPMMLGTLKPVILFPLATASRLSTEQMEAILIHELAHIKRYDYLVNIAQTIIETILFFNPFVWMTSRIIRVEREHCCDDMVLAHTYPLSYAKALATLETNRFSSGSLLMGANGTSKNHLLNRIKRIMELRPNQATDNRIVAITLITGVMLVSLICFSPSFAQDKKEAKKKQKQEEKKPTRMWVKEEHIIIEDKDGTKHTYRSLEEMPQEDRKRFVEGDKKNNTVTYFGKDGKKLVERRDSVVIERSEEAKEFVDDFNVGAVIEDAMASVDWKEIGDEIDRSMKAVDWDQMDKDIRQSMKEADAALKEIDWEKMEREIEMAGRKLDSIDHKKIKAELNKARAETRKAMEETHKALAESRKALAESHRALAESRRDMERSRADQRRSMADMKRMQIEERHRNSVDSNNRMFGRMVGDGLVDTSKNFELIMTRDELIVNDKKQPGSLHKKYLPYLHGNYYRNIHKK